MEFGPPVALLLIKAPGNTEMGQPARDSVQPTGLAAELGRPLTSAVAWKTEHQLLFQSDVAALFITAPSSLKSCHSLTSDLPWLAGCRSAHYS